MKKSKLSVLEYTAVKKSCTAQINECNEVIDTHTTTTVKEKCEGVESQRSVFCYICEFKVNFSKIKLCVKKLIIEDKNE